MTCRRRNAEIITGQKLRTNNEENAMPKLILIQGGLYERPPLRSDLMASDASKIRWESQDCPTTGLKEEVRILLTAIFLTVATLSALFITQGL